MPILFIIFIVVPVIEIALFIKAGDWFGLGPTLLMIVLTAIIGVSLLRKQGLNTLSKAQQKINHGEIPALEMIEGIMLVVAGALLITPGFFTDTVGFLLLIPALRQSLFTYVLQKKVQMFVQSKQASFDDQFDNPSNQGHRTIDGEYKNTDDSIK